MTDVVQIPTDTVALPGGGAIPLVGFGTWQLKGEECYAARLAAFEAGYRHLDTATMYRNEAEVGRAIADSGVERDEVFVTTKYNPRSGDPNDLLGRASRRWASTTSTSGWCTPPPTTNVRSGRASGRAVRREARDIGVCNFSLGQVDQVHEPRRAALGQPDRVAPVAVRRPRRRRPPLTRRGARGLQRTQGRLLSRPRRHRVADEVGRTPHRCWSAGTSSTTSSSSPGRRRPTGSRSNADVGGFELSADADGRPGPPGPRR